MQVSILFPPPYLLKSEKISGRTFYCFIFLLNSDSARLVFFKKNLIPATEVRLLNVHDFMAMNGYIYIILEGQLF